MFLLILRAFWAEFRDTAPSQTTVSPLNPVSEAPVCGNTHLQVSTNTRSLMKTIKSINR